MFNTTTVFIARNLSALGAPVLLDSLAIGFSLASPVFNL